MSTPPKGPGKKNVQQSADQYDSIEQSSAASQGSTADIAELIRRLDIAGGVPISLRLTALAKINTFELLRNQRPVTVAFPPCSEEMLALIKTTNTLYRDKDDVARYFDEYFRFGNKHVIIRGNLFEQMDPTLLNCGEGQLFSAPGSEFEEEHTEWLGDCCLCSPCLTLDGNRNSFTPHDPDQPRPATPGIHRLFAGDVVWLFFMERMGIPQILGAILDSYASNGRLPISNGSLNVNIRDDITALVLEVMTRQVKTGMSTTVRDRASVYRTVAGWTSTAARKLNLDTNINSSFNTLFHKLIYHALEFYKDKRLAVAIQSTAVPTARPSVATLITISDTIDILKKRFEAFSYGRNYYNTLSGIVWTIAAMSVIRRLATTLGIPPAFNTPDEFIPAAYDILVLKRPVTSGEANRYLVHKECADNGRDILLDLEVIDHKSNGPEGALDQWLSQIEAKVEGYRTAYRTLTGVDLGASPNPVIEQQV